MAMLDTKDRSVTCALFVIAITLVIIGVNIPALAREGGIKIDTKDRVEFHSDTTPTDEFGNPNKIIYAQLFKPAGDGPFPALVLLHDCLGLHITHKKWAERLVKWGYVALLVDSLGPRGIEDCSRDFGWLDSTRDSYGALNYLVSLDFVDMNRIGLLGWSLGATGALNAVSYDFQELYNIKRKFKAAIAYYPSCPSGDFYAPILIFFGDNDFAQSNFLKCKKVAN